MQQTKTTEYTFFSAAHGTFSKVGHSLVYKRSLNKYKKIEIISYSLSDHNGTTLEIHSQRNYIK
jgi:hypothetical protein